MLRIAIALIMSMFLPANMSSDGSAELPKGLPPVFGTARANKGADDEWQIEVTIPKTRWEVVGQVVPKSEWPRLDVVVERDTRTLIFGGPSALAESEVVGIDGKSIERDVVLKKLMSETAVLVSVSDAPVDPYYLQLIKPDSLIIILGPRGNAPAPELLPAPKGTVDPKPPGTKKK